MVDKKESKQEKAPGLVEFPEKYAGGIWGESPAAQPYGYVQDGTFSGPEVPDSPDPLVAFRWNVIKNDLEIYLRKPVSVSTDHPDSFSNLSSLTGNTPNVTVNGTGSIKMDFGIENAAWLEFDSDDLTGTVDMSISEYNQPAIVMTGPENPIKTKIPGKYGNTYRLELNSELYEGVRFGWIHVNSFSSPWHITGVRLVCQIKPANYCGSFSCSDVLVNKIWYDAAYTVKLNLTNDYFGAILMDRGDRFSWTGDAYPAQAASMVAFKNYDFVKQNLESTSTQNNGIESFSLCWILSLIDYYNYTGDGETLSHFITNACEKLDHAHSIYGTNPDLVFYGWDERLGAGFENASSTEPQNAYKMLAIRAWSEFATAMNSLGHKDLRDKYSSYASEKINELRQNESWYNSFGLHSASDAITAGFTNQAEQNGIYINEYTDRVNRVSFSAFNQYFVIQAMAKINKYDDALSSIRDLWGGQHNYGGTTSFEVFRPSWVQVLGMNDPVPNNQASYTSLCHPWGAGVLKWLNEEALGIKPTSPGFETYDILPHPGRTLTSVSGKTPTPKGHISASFNTETGSCSITAPSGTTGRFGIPKVEKTIDAIAINGVLAWDGIYHGITGIGGAEADADFVYFTAVQPGTYTLEVTYRGTTPSYEEPPVEYPAKFIKQDTATSGNWGGVYGRDGYVLCSYNGAGSDVRVLPSYIRDISYSINSNAQWSNGTRDSRAPSADSTNGAERKVGCIYTQDPEGCKQTMTVDITKTGTEDFNVALYFVDWDSTARNLGVEMFDMDTLKLVSPIKLVKNYSDGTYLVYSYNKSVRFRIYQIRGANATLSGIFFDGGKQ